MVSDLYEALPCMFELLALWQPFLWSVQLLQGCFNRSHPLFTLQHTNKSEPRHNFIMPFWNVLDIALMKIAISSHATFFQQLARFNSYGLLFGYKDLSLESKKWNNHFSNGNVFWVGFDSLHNKKCKWSLCVWCLRFKCILSLSSRSFLIWCYYFGRWHNIISRAKMS